MQLLKPDYKISGYTVADSSWLFNRGIQVVFSDLDNTLVPHGETGSEQLDAWINQLKEEGITLVGTSNNDGKRAQRFRDQHGIEVIEDCRKPRTKVLESYINTHNLKKEKMILMGDQVFGDVLCGNRLGVTTVLVRPIKENSPFSVQTTWILDWFFLKSRRWKKKWLEGIQKNRIS